MIYSVPSRIMKALYTPKPFKQVSKNANSALGDEAHILFGLISVSPYAVFNTAGVPARYE